MHALDERPSRWLPLIWSALLLVLLLPAAGLDAVASGLGDTPWPSGPPEQVVGELRQDVLPQLTARRDAAEARAASIRAFSAGDGTLTQALPELSGASLHERAILEARLARLDDRGEDRAVERVAALPEVPEPWRTRAQAALESCHEAEAAADGLERQLLLGLRGWLRIHPWLQGASLDLQRAPFQAAIDAARDVPDDAPDRRAVLDAAERAADDLAALDTTLVAVRRAALVSEPELPDVSSDLDALMGNRSEGASLRLALLASVAPEHQDIGARLDAWVARQRAKVEAMEVPGVDALPESAEAEAVLTASRARAGAAPPALAPLWTARAVHDQAVVDAALARDAATAGASSTADTIQEAQDAEKSEDAASALTATLILNRVPAEERVAALEAQLTEELADLDTTRANTERTLSEARRVLSRVKTPQTPTEVDESYAKLRTLLRTLRESARLYGTSISLREQAQDEALAKIGEERAKINAERRALADLTDETVQRARRDALDAWDAELDEERVLLRRRVEQVSEARDLALQTVDQAATLRRRFSTWVSRSERDVDDSGRLQEMVDELSVMAPTFMAVQRARFSEGTGGTWWWVAAARDLLLGSLGFFATALVWWLARRYADVVLDIALKRVAEWRGWRREDLVTVEDPLHRVAVTFVDVFAAWALFLLQPDGLPEIGIALVFVFEIQLIRLELAVFDLFIAKPGERRPTLIRLEEGGRRAVRRTVFFLGLWLAVRRVLLSFAHDVLHGFATEFVVGVATWVALLVVVVALLYLLAPHVRSHIAGRNRETRLSSLLTAKPPIGFGGVQAAAGLMFILFVGLRGLWFRVAREGVGAPVFAALERFRVGRTKPQVEATPPEPLSDALREQLRGSASDRAFQDRPVARRALVGAVLAWKEERRQGLIAVLGDTGEGREAALEHWKADWEAEGLTTTWVTLDRRLATERDAYAWLAHAFDMSQVPDSADEAVAALEERLESGVYVVMGLHLAFLRTVGGFDALRALLDVMHADGSERCWILASYRPAWRYLERLGTALNVHLVRQVVDLPGLSADQLRTMTERLAEKAGYTMDFDGMAATGAFAAEHDVELQRGIETYYRLLAASSAGNPAVALDMWTSCLSVGPGNTLLVHLSDAVRMAALPELSDDQLFVLAAIRTQGELDTAELSEVLNMGPAKVRALVRQMVSVGLLARSEHGVHVHRAHLPAITLTLRRRHFVHWS